MKRRRTLADVWQQVVHPGWFFVLLWLGVAVVAVVAYVLGSTY